MKVLKRKIALLIAVCMCMSLAACGNSVSSHAPGEYILETEYRPDYRILQLTDIHIANKDNRSLQYRFLDLVISDARPDMIIVTGDLFTFADKTVAKELFAFLDSYGLPWTVTFGNHDEQCYFSVEWMTDYLNHFGSNCLFKDIRDDDVFGYANFAINLTDGDRVAEQLIILDSNRYNYGEYWGYDYIKEDQIDWYERLVRYSAEQNGGEVVPSVMFFHIPVPEFQIAWDEAQKGSSDAVLEYGTMNEDCSCPLYNSGLFDRALTLGSSSAMICGHDHINNSRVLYKGIQLSYGITSTDRIYYEDGMMGGQVIVVHEDHSLSFEPYYHTYDEVRDE